MRPRRRSTLHISFLLMALTFITPLVHAISAAQPTVRATDAWIKASATTETTAYASVENGTMYDVFLVGASAEIAAVAELMEVSGGAPSPAKEVPVAAFGRLDMTPEGVHVRLSQLKRPLSAGERIELALRTDGGDTLAVTAVVK